MPDDPKEQKDDIDLEHNELQELLGIEREETFHSSRRLRSSSEESMTEVAVTVNYSSTTDS